MEKRLMGNILSGLKVLIVEDQPEARAILKSILCDMSIKQVYEAEDGRTGVQLLGAPGARIDMILCDWNMPIVSGLDFFRHLRAKGNETPFLIITGRGDQKSVMEARDIGVNGYIIKPFNPAQIETKLRAVAARMKAA